MYQRTSAIRTERLDTDGIIEGTLATNGEASDGHILEVRGIEVPSGSVPLLFGHDAHSGRNNLGSWASFQVMGGKRATSLGDAQLHGTAQIELGGAGEQAAFRQDVAHMVSEGHIGAFSVRWDAIGDPVQRSALPKEHYAYSEERTAGFYFESSRLLEGSIVTIGADSAALVARALESPARNAWARVLGDEMLGEVFNRVEDMQTRLEVLELLGTRIPSEGLVPLPLREPINIVAGDVTPEPVTPEPSGSSTERVPESLPAVKLDRMVELFKEFMDRSDDRIRAQQEDAIRRLVG